jgi:prolyl oligopeptidase
MIKPNNYPPARKSDQVDDYHGVKVADPYRWLEDLDSEETRAWVEAENKLSFAYLAAIPARTALKDRLTKLWNYEKYGTPFKEGNRYFYMRNSGLQNQSVLYTVTSLDAQPQMVLDPNTLSADGTVAVSGLQPSPDGKLLAYSLAASGSESSRRRNEQGSFRRSQVGEVFRSFLDPRRQGIFLQPLRRAEERHAERHELLSKSLLS